MTKFSPGDTVRCTRNGLEAAVVSTLPASKRGPTLVLCKWTNAWDDTSDAYFRESDLTLVRKAEQTQETTKT